MDAAKSAVNKIIGKSGHHTTEVDEDVNRSVTSETVKPHRHEETTEAVDREVHQHHYHTTVQPLEDKKVLPEQHTHQQMPVQEREFVHGDTDKVRSAVDTEAAKFGDTTRTAQTTHSASAAPVAAGEHVHHHVHERVQPVVNRETVAPEVVHTTVPIHETHHAEAQHHGISTLPTKTLAEFEGMGGKVTGGTHRHEEYEGHPRPYNPELQQTESGATGTHGTTGSNVSGVTHSSATGTSTGYTDYSSGGTTGATGTSLGGRAEGNTASRAIDAATSRTSGVGSEHDTGRSLDQSSTGHSGGAATLTHRGNTDTSASSNTHKDTSRDVSSSDIQTPSQGKDPNLTETNTKGGLKGEGVDGSHSAVFGLTPDGHKHTDTSHTTTSLKPAHTKDSSNAATGDAGSRSATGGAGGGVAEQMQDPRVGEKGHGGSSFTDSGSGKPGAGAPGGEQGFGDVASK